MAKYLVTGGHSYLNFALINRLLALGHNVTCIVDAEMSQPLFALKQASMQSEHPHYEAVFCHASQPEHFVPYLKDVKACYHLAQHSPNTVSLLSAALAIFQACGEASVPIVYASSSAIYGNNVDSPLVEQSIANPTDFMAASRLSIEHFASVAALKYQTPVIGLRLFDVYGHFNAADSVLGQVQNKLLKSVKDKHFTIGINRHRIFDFVFIDDVVDAFIQACELNTIKAQFINICSGKATTTAQLVQLCSSISHCHFEATNETTQAGSHTLSVGSNALARRLLNFECKVDLFTGLKRVLTLNEPEQHTLEHHLAACLY